MKYYQDDKVCVITPEDNLAKVRYWTHENDIQNVNFC